LIDFLGASTWKSTIRKRGAELIRKFEKEDLKLFYAHYSSTFSLGGERKE
jgi:hypothetical protein